MGYDCTLHLVDPERIRRVVVPRLLGRDTEPSPYDRAPGARAAWDAARAALADADDPERAGRCACQLAVMWSSAELPHVYLRGLAFGLWREEDAGTDAIRRLWALTQDPQSLFEDLVAARPALAGRFPVGFEDNYCTGFYVPPERVPGLRDWLAGQLAAMTVGEAEVYGPLSRLLAVAERRGLGFWEATDLSVQSVHEDWIALPVPGTVDQLPLPFGFQWVSRDGDRVWLAGRGRGRAAVLDLATLEWTQAPVAARQVVRTREGHVVALVPGGTGLQAVDLDDGRVVVAPNPNWSLDGLARLGDDVYGWPNLHTARPLLRLEAGRWEPEDAMPNLPPEPVAPGSPLTGHAIAAGAGVLFWGHEVVRRTAAGWHSLAPAAHPPAAYGPSPARTVDGALWAAGRDGSLYRWPDDDGEPGLVLADSSVMGLEPGPGSDVLASFGGRDDALRVGLVSPDGRVRGLTGAELGLDEGSFVKAAFVVGDTARVLVTQVTAGLVVSFPVALLDG